MQIDRGPRRPVTPLTPDELAAHVADAWRSELSVLEHILTEARPAATHRAVLARVEELKARLDARARTTG